MPPYAQVLVLPVVGGSVFLSHPPPYVLRQGPSLILALTESLRQASQHTPGILLSLVYPPDFLTWILGKQALILMQTLYLPNHPPSNPLHTHKRCLFKGLLCEVAGFRTNV